MTRLARYLTVRSPHHRTASRWASITTPEVARQHRQKKRGKVIGQVFGAIGCVILGAVLAAAFMLGVAGW